jgi:hypothetical protein
LNINFPFHEALSPPAAPATPELAPQGETATPLSTSSISSPLLVAADPVIERMAAVLRKRAAAHSRIARHFYRAARDLQLSARLIR